MLTHIWLMFKAKMVIFQSKANLDEKILFGKITHLYEKRIRKSDHKALFVCLFVCFQFVLSGLVRISSY